MRQAKKLIFCTLFLSCQNAKADLFHYNNIILGDRAIGLGGAYGAISDDASGIIYNPAGIAFAMSNDISGSANAYYKRNVVYKKIVGDHNFEEKAEGMVASFFGGIQKLDSFVPKLVAGFAVYNPDAEIKDQNDLISIPEYGIASFHRTVKLNASTLKAGGAIGYRLFSWLSFGLGANFVNIGELIQDYQLSVSQIFQKNVNIDGTVTPGYYVASPTDASRVYKIKDSALAGRGNLYWAEGNSQNSKLASQAIEPMIGMQAAFHKFVIGVSARKGFFISDTLEKYMDSTKFYRFEDGSVVRSTDIDDSIPALDNSSTWQDAELYGPNAIGHSNPTIPMKLVTKHALQNLPTEIRTGMAWFASPSFLWSLDIVHHTAAKGALDTQHVYDRDSVTNFATGMEYFITPSLPVRAGFFTNFDARYKDKIGTWALEKIDYYGGSLYLSWSEASSQIGGGAVVQLGKGEAKKLGPTGPTQAVSATSYSFAFSASHQL